MASKETSIEEKSITTNNNTAISIIKNKEGTINKYRGRISYSI